MKGGGECGDVERGDNVHQVMWYIDSSLYRMDLHRCRFGALVSPGQGRAGA